MKEEIRINLSNEVSINVNSKVVVKSIISDLLSQISKGDITYPSFIGDNYALFFSLDVEESVIYKYIGLDFDTKEQEYKEYKKEVYSSDPNDVELFNVCQVIVSRYKIFN